MIVVEDQRDIRVDDTDIVDQRREKTLDDLRLGGLQPRERLRSNTGMYVLHCSHDVRPEESRLVVARVEGNPTRVRTAGRVGEPPGDERRFTESGRRCDERELLRGALLQPLDQPGTR